MEKRFNFTKKLLDKIEATNEVTTYHDVRVKELKLVVQPTGTKNFIYNRRINGKPERIKLGRFPDLTIEKARSKVSEVNTKIANGINPKESKAKDQKEWTLDDLFTKFIKRYAKLHKKNLGC